MLLPENEAKIKYLSGDYEIIQYGQFVTCAVTGKPIPIDDLKYWNFQRQEAYIDCAAAYQREREVHSGVPELATAKTAKNS